MASLTPLERSKIENAVEQIKLNTGLSYPENELLEIADALGAEVVSAELPDFNGKKVKGYIRWLDEGTSPKYRAKIYLNSSQSETTKAFTLAHELGHFLLHKGAENFRIDIEDYATEDTDNEETEANYFAGTLLMPANKFLVALKEAKNVSEVADAFGVSVPAVEARIKWLRHG